MSMAVHDILMTNSPRNTGVSGQCLAHAPIV